MHLKPFAILFAGLISLHSSAQEVSQMKNRDILVGLSLPPLGNRGLGFYLEVGLFYEFRKSDFGSWFDRFKFDVVIKYHLTGKPNTLPLNGR